MQPFCRQLCTCVRYVKPQSMQHFCRRPNLYPRSRHHTALRTTRRNIRHVFRLPSHPARARTWARAIKGNVWNVLSMWNSIKNGLYCVLVLSTSWHGAYLHVRKHAFPSKSTIITICIITSCSCWFVCFRGFQQLLSHITTIVLSTHNFPGMIGRSKCNKFSVKHTRQL